MCCVGTTALGPAELLASLQEADEVAGRPASGAAGRSGARTLDLEHDGVERVGPLEELTGGERERD